MKWLRNILSRYNISAYFAGHCHSLQYALLKNTHFVISGAGSKFEEPCSPRIGWSADNQLGFVQVLVYENQFKLFFWNHEGVILKQVYGSPRK